MYLALKTETCKTVILIRYQTFLFSMETKGGFFVLVIGSSLKSFIGFFFVVVVVVVFCFVF